MLPSEAVTRLLEDTFSVVETWAKECRETLVSEPTTVEATPPEAAAEENPRERQEPSVDGEPFADLINAFKDVEEQFLRVQSATIHATTAFLDTLRDELNTVSTGGSATPPEASDGSV